VYDDIIAELKQDGELARDAFNNFSSQFSSPTQLNNTISEIENFDFWDTYSGYADVFGDAYEFLIERYADKGGAGEYFTPRPLIRAMVEFVDPEYRETVYDPASGTNGFLIESYNFVGEKTADEFGPFANSPNDPQLYEENLFGREITSQTYRLGLMNYILHDIDATAVTQDRGNSLTKSVIKEYDVILANPPYGGNGSDQFVDAWVETERPEANFLQLIMRSLSEDGRAGVVVPEGSLFRSGAEEAIRKKLLNQYKIDTILALPKESFQPYAGVEAYVLFFRRDRDGTDEFWFYDARTDYDTVRKSNPLEYEKHLADLINYQANREDVDRYFKVQREEVDEDGYELHLKKYKEFKYEGHRPPVEIAQDIKDELFLIESELDQMVGDTDD
jgi:type I restriction enzyme M protein